MISKLTNQIPSIFVGDRRVKDPEGTQVKLISRLKPRRF